MIPGFLLFWVEYRRDRERVRVRRVITYSSSLSNRAEWWISIALEVTNLSPFPITLTAAGYNVGGKEQHGGRPFTRHRYFDFTPGDIPFLAAAKLLPEFVTKHTPDGFLTTDLEPITWPLQVPARTKVWIYAGESDVKGCKYTAPFTTHLPHHLCLQTSGCSLSHPRGTRSTRESMDLFPDGLLRCMPYSNRFATRFPK